eukprot:2663763-Pleurochrysis_carterae.AAC.3
MRVTQARASICASANLRPGVTEELVGEPPDLPAPLPPCHAMPCHAMPACFLASRPLPRTYLLSSNLLFFDRLQFSSLPSWPCLPPFPPSPFLPSPPLPHSPI